MRRASSGSVALAGGAALGLDLGVGGQAGVVVFPQAARVEVDDVFEAVQRILHVEDLVDLLLIAGDDEAGAAMVEDVGDLVADRVLVERDGHAAGALRGDHRPVERRAVAADDGDVVSGRSAERQQAERQRLDLGGGLGPGPALPDAELFLAIGRPRAETFDVARQQRRNGFRLVHPVDPPLGAELSPWPLPSCRGISPAGRRTKAGLAPKRHPCNTAERW